jgi:hypothetical protein
LNYYRNIEKSKNGSALEGCAEKERRKREKKGEKRKR